MILLKYRTHSLIFLLLAAVYIAQIILVKPSEVALQKYHISATEARVLALAIALPYILIWVIALIGYLRLKAYSDTIKKSKDGAAFKTISLGVLFLALWLPASTIFSNEVIRAYTANPNLVASMTILNNYLNLLMLAPGFVLVYLGSKNLAKLAKTSVRTPNQLMVLLYISFAVLYTFFVLHDPVRQVASDPNIKATFYQPDWLIVTTTIIPRLLMWYIGLRAVHNIYLYRKKIKGSLYRFALHKFAAGFSLVVATSIILRCLQSLSPQIGRLSLTLLFILLYIILIMLGLGYLWMMQGSRKLLYIERLSSK